MLNSISKRPFEEETAIARLDENKNKNRNEILPGDIIVSAFRSQTYS
jgi:hypothetical protein